LDLYALFKQASEGDNNQERPGGFDFKAIAKHRCMGFQKNMTKDKAMQQYIELVNTLYQQYH